jgi:endogenous inhibitor of DNA gyrase (YacG/DUF329 family)
MDEPTVPTAEVRKVNGICPRCGNPSHWSNADHGYMHSNCETSA